MPDSSPIRRGTMRRPEASGGGIASVNQAITRQGDEGRAAGGIWGRQDRRAEPQGVQAEAMGASLSAPGDSEQLFGNNALPSAMNISPDTAAEIAQQQYPSSGAPVGPTPLVGSGIHEESIQRPYVPFSPPPARVTTSMASSSPKVRMTGADTGDLDTLTAGQHLAHALQTPLGDAQVGVMASDIGRSTRLDLMIDREMRAESRFY